MLQGFKEFILRGNVIDLAVAVVIGTAFSAIVVAIVENVFNPAIGALFNAESLKTAFPLVIPTTGGGSSTLYFGAVLAAIIQFLLVAVVVYFALIVPINFIKKRAFQKAGGDGDEKAPPTELELLSEIRDLLAKAPAGEGKRTPQP